MQTTKFKSPFYLCRFWLCSINKTNKNAMIVYQCINIPQCGSSSLFPQQTQNTLRVHEMSNVRKGTKIPSLAFVGISSMFNHSGRANNLTKCRTILAMNTFWALRNPNKTLIKPILNEFWGVYWTVSDFHTIEHMRQAIYFQWTISSSEPHGSGPTFWTSPNKFVKCYANLAGHFQTICCCWLPYYNVFTASFCKKLIFMRIFKWNLIALLATCYWKSFA